MPTSAGPAVTLLDDDTLTDLTTFLGRAQRVDRGGVIRLIAQGTVLACYVAPVHDEDLVVLGLRTPVLAEPAAVDATVSLAELVEAARTVGGDRRLALPCRDEPGVRWAGTSPPRRGWHEVGAIGTDVLAGRAADGIAEVARGAAPGLGATAVAALRARVWGRPLSDDLPDLPAGVAFAAHTLGFLGCADAPSPVRLYRSGPWCRATTLVGHVLARRTPLLPA